MKQAARSYSPAEPRSSERRPIALGRARSLSDDPGHVGKHRIGAKRCLGNSRQQRSGARKIAFHRGHWCPYCRLNAVALAEVQDKLGPTRIVAISAERQAFTRTIKAEAGARFPFLTDFGNGYALSLNLAIWVDEKMCAMIAGAGWDVPTYQGQAPWVLPIPSVFVVGMDGVIRARHVDPDYRRRMEMEDLRAAVSLLD